jgi:hypothetical protein
MNGDSLNSTGCRSSSSSWQDYQSEDTNAASWVLTRSSISRARELLAGGSRNSDRILGRAVFAIGSDPPFRRQSGIRRKSSG